MNRILIKVHRSVYSPSDVKHTMTVRELIETLEAFANDEGDGAIVITSHDNGYTYGGVTCRDIEALGDFDDDCEDDD